MGLTFRDAGSTLINDRSGAINLPGAQSIVGGGTLINQGAITASPGSGRANFGVVFDEQGGTLSAGDATAGITPSPATQNRPEVWNPRK